VSFPFLSPPFFLFLSWLSESFQRKRTREAIPSFFSSPFPFLPPPFHDSFVYYFPCSKEEKTAHFSFFLLSSPFMAPPVLTFFLFLPFFPKSSKTRTCKISNNLPFPAPLFLSPPSLPPFFVQLTNDNRFIDV